MLKYRLIFTSVMLAVGLLGMKLPFLIAFCVAAFAFALARPLWLSVLRPLAYFAGMVKPNSLDWEVIAWKDERAGRLEEALQA
jgi:hypothetical protein